MPTSSRRPARGRENFLVFGAPAIEDAEIEEVVATLRSGWLGTGPRVARFERDFADYKGVQAAAAFSSCSAALHLALLALRLRPGDEVITSALTFCATVNAIIHAGATPVLADVDPGTMNLDPADVLRKVTPRTRALLPVHFAGRPCDMEALWTIAEQHRLRIVEDCAHAIETEYRGRKAGTLGDFGCFSFYVTKNVATGEGGMLLARREEDLAQARVLGLHGMSKDAWKRFSDDGYKHYQVVDAGFKYNMMDIQAAIGIHQLRRVEANWRRRKRIWDQYHAALRDLPVVLPADPEPDTRHAYHLYTLLIDGDVAGIGRDALLEAMTARNIGVGVHYQSIPEHPHYRERYGWQAEDFPNAMRIGRQTVSIPLSARLSEVDVQDVIDAVRSIIGKA